MKTPVLSRSLTSLFAASAAASALFLAACDKSEAPAATSAAAAPSGPVVSPDKADLSSLKGKTIHLAFIPKGMQNVYWKSVEKGMRVAEAEEKAAGINLTIDWQGPASEEDVPAEVSLVETYVSQKLDGIILCPMDLNALVAPADRARHAGIPLVIVDSSLNYKDIVSFVGTNNKNAGVLAATELAKEMGDKGNVILLRYRVGSASTTDREEGFLAELKKNHPNLTVISSNIFSGDDIDKAISVSADLLNTFKGKVDGVFAPNEPSTNAMLKALENAKLAGNVKFVGFDGDTINMDGLARGEIGAIVLQYPYQMGYLGVKTMLAKLAGQNVVDNVDTGTVVLRKDNQNEPAVKALLANTVQQ